MRLETEKALKAEKESREQFEDRIRRITQCRDATENRYGLFELLVVATPMMFSAVGLKKKIRCVKNKCVRTNC